MQDEVETDFQNLHARLSQLEEAYNPQHENLHFDSLVRADADLYSALLQLAREGLILVHHHRAVFLKKGLYSDGMFWYDLCLLTSAGAVRVQNDGTQSVIPEPLVNALTETLIEVSEYAVGGGDMHKRASEALANTLWAFFSEDLVKLAQQKSRAISRRSVRGFVEDVIRRVKELKRRQRG